MKRTLHTSWLIAAVAAGMAGTTVAAGTAITPEVVTNRAPMQSMSAWTDADFATARPITPTVNYLPPTVFDLNAAAAEAVSGSPTINVAGSKGGADAAHLYESRAVSQAGFEGSTGLAMADPEPYAVGTGNLHFTSTRTFPNASDTTYPTRTVGKLYFRDPVTNSNYVCSGSMIKKGVVLTSGHCIHNGSGRFYTDFVFRPGLRAGVYPYGTWTNWVQARTTSAWVTGRGNVPNTGDWATIVFGPDARGNRIGNYTGWLGYQGPICSGRHQTTLGYPVNLDSGLQMHRSDSQSTSYGSLNNCTWGTDMTGGSSGGPVVLNLQQPYTNSNPVPSENNGNRVVATVSWGYTNTAVRVQGGSIVDSVFGALIGNTCTSNPTAC